jgi:hypothetical protein
MRPSYQIHEEIVMNQQPSIGQIALGTMLGNFGCFLLWLVFSCIGYVMLSVLGVGILGALQRGLR